MTSSQPKMEKESLRRRIAAQLDRVDSLVNRGTRWKDIASELADHGIADDEGTPLPPLTLRNHVDYIRRNPETYGIGGELAAPDVFEEEDSAVGSTGRVPEMASVGAARAAAPARAEAGYDLDEEAASPAHYRSTLAEMRRTLEDLNQPAAPPARTETRHEPVGYGRSPEPPRAPEPPQRSPQRAPLSPSGVAGASSGSGASGKGSAAASGKSGRAAYGYDEPPARSGRAPMQGEHQAPRSQPAKPTVSAPPPMPQGGRQAAQGNPQMSPNLIICNDRGGLGKTLLANFLMTAVAELDIKARLIEYDVNSRLEGHFIPERLEWRRISQDFLEIMNQGGDALFNYWDPLAPELQEGGLIIDFGANVSNAFFDWADLSGVDYYLGQGDNLAFFVPVTADMAAARTGISTLHRIHAIFPKARRVLVENEYSGRFTDFQDPEYEQQKSVLIANQEIDVVTMPACRAPNVWPRIAGQRLARLARVDRNALVEMGIEPLKAARSVPLISGWINDFIERLKPLVTDCYGRR